MPIETLAEKHRIIDEAAIAAGRDPSDIRRIANVNGAITDGPIEGFLQGPADLWVENLTSLAIEHGFDSFVLWSDRDLQEQTERFVDVAAKVRAAVAAAR